MTFCKGADVRARFLGAGCAGLGWCIDSAGIAARVRAPALSRRLSSFLFAGWLPHAKYASWGCLGLTRGDRRCRSQFSEEDSPNRRRRPGHRLGCRACLAGRSASSSRRRGQAADRPDEPDEFPRNGGDHDRRLLPPRHHLPISRAKSDLRLPCDGADFPGEPLVPALHALSHLRRHPVGPGGFDDQFARDNAACLCDAGRATPFAA